MIWSFFNDLNSCGHISTIQHHWDLSRWCWRKNRAKCTLNPSDSSELSDPTAESLVQCPRDLTSTRRRVARHLADHANMSATTWLNCWNAIDLRQFWSRTGQVGSTSRSLDSITNKTTWHVGRRPIVTACRGIGVTWSVYPDSVYVWWWDRVFEPVWSSVLGALEMNTKMRCIVARPTWQLIALGRTCPWALWRPWKSMFCVL